MGSVEFLNNPVVVWFSVGLLFFLVELAAPGLVVFFFGVGAWVVMLLCFFMPLSLNTQLILFILVTIISLLLLRKSLSVVLKGFVKARQDPRVDFEEFIGQKVIVKEAIALNNPGKVEFRGTLWQAESKESIPSGTMVKIINKNNITFEVVRL